MRSTQPPRFNESDSTTNLIRSLLLTVIVTDAAALIASYLGGFGNDYLIPIGSLLVLSLICLLFLMRGNLIPARIILPSSLFVVLTYIITFPPGYGLHDINMVAYAAVISLAGLTLGQTGAFVFAALIIIAVFAIGNAEMQGLLVSPTSDLTLPLSPIAISIVILAITFIQRALINLFNESAQRARENEKEISERNEELKTFTTGLEQLVQARTAEIERANRYAENRAKQFEAISQVSRAINQTQGLQDLLPQITQVISQQFGFYHVGIFLLDTNSEFAVLVASNSEGGQRMLVREHKLKVGQVGIVGNVAGTGNPRIALDTGADAIYFNNPDLPETRSEMALPLYRSGEKLIGVLDVQSTEQNAFGQEDIKILTTLADQVSIAIANSRLYEETQKALLESEMLYRSDIQSGWGQFARSQKLTGVRRQGLKSDLLLEPVNIPGVAEVIRSGEVYQKDSDINEKTTNTTIPMKLRGEIVGIVNVKTDDDRTLNADDMDIITAIIERAALSLENARLLNESRNSAEKERLISEMSARISAGTEIESILQITARELGNQIGGAHITVEMGGGDE